jgi:hypothetical protein
VSWVNLETTGIDLSADANTRQTYEIRITCAAVTSNVTKNFRVYTE